MGFQFHKGTIKTYRFFNVATQSYNFNSIKVQLKLKSALDFLHIKQFQFHKGTIKTVRRGWGADFELTISIP